MKKKEFRFRQKKISAPIPILSADTVNRYRISVSHYFVSLFFQLKFHKKLRNDWKFGTHKERSFNVPGLVSSSQIFANSSKIVSGVDEMIVVSDTGPL